MGLTPILSRCSFRLVYAPPIFSRAHNCVVAGQAVELSATTANSSSDELRIALDVDQIDRYSHWIQSLTEALAGQAEEPRTDAVTTTAATTPPPWPSQT